jgi:hypothetical protein
MGVLFELDHGRCRVVATDRYRLAISSMPVQVMPDGSQVTPAADYAVPHFVGQRTGAGEAGGEYAVPHSIGQGADGVLRAGDHALPQLVGGSA